jgi:hypothetical protein
VKVFGCNQGCPSRHILDNDGRMAGDVFTHVPRHHAAVRIESASGAPADDDANCLTFVEVIR